MIDDRNDISELSEDEISDLRTENEYFDEWLERDDDLHDMSLDEYTNIRQVEDYGDSNEDMYDEDWDEYDD